MNSACLIAACAVSKRTQNPKMYNTYFTEDFEIYYKINFRMYLHFNPIMAVGPATVPYYINGSDIFCQSALEFRATQVEPQSIVKSHSFTVNSKKCPNGPDKYVEENIERFINSTIWEQSKEEIIRKYTEDIKSKYNITLDRGALDYSIQYCWEVDGI